MAVRAYNANLGVALSSGGYQSVDKGGAQPATTTTAAAIAAAAANGTIAGDGTALGLVNAITTALATDKANADLFAGDAVLQIDTAVIDTRNKLKAVLDGIYQSAISNGLGT